MLTTTKSTSNTLTCWMNKAQGNESYLKVYPSYFPFKIVCYALTFFHFLASCRRNTNPRYWIDICYLSLRITRQAHVTKYNFPLASIIKKSMTSFPSVIIVNKLCSGHRFAWMPTEVLALPSEKCELSYFPSHSHSRAMTICGEALLFVNFPN